MASTSRLFLTTTLVAGTVRQMNTIGVTTASNTKASAPALSLLGTNVQLSPEAAAPTGAAPAAGTAFNNIGWQSAASADSLGDGGLTRAATVPVILSWTSGSAGTVGFTVVLYVGEAEIGRGTLSAATTTAAAPYSVPVSITAGISIASGAPVQMAVYAALPANAGLGAVSYTLNYGISATTGTNIAPVTYSIRATRSGADVSASSELAQRTLSLTLAPSESSAGSETGARQVDSARRTAEAAPVPAVAAERSVSAPRTTSEAAVVGDLASRVLADYRRSIEVLTQAQDVALRLIVVRPVARDAATATDLASKTITYGRGVTHYFVPTDPPVVVGSKAIRGYVRLADGTIYPGGATVVLVRDDGLQVATTTSAADGSYVFVRDFRDTSGYHVLAYATVAGVPETASTVTGLVPL